MNVFKSVEMGFILATMNVTILIHWMETDVMVSVFSNQGSSAQEDRLPLLTCVLT